MKMMMMIMNKYFYYFLNYFKFYVRANVIYFNYIFLYKSKIPYSANNPTP